MQIRKGTENDIEEVAALYDAVNDYLESHTNYPGWRKGVYPIREDAAQGIGENDLFVAEAEGQIAGTFILRHRPEEAYALADWGNQLDTARYWCCTPSRCIPGFSVRESENSRWNSFWPTLPGRR